MINLKFHKSIIIIIIFIFHFSFFICNCQAQQDGIVRGFVYDKKSGQPVPYINVYLYKTQIGAMTNEDGYYAISKIPPGNYKLMVSSMGYDSLKININVKSDEVITKKIFLNESILQLKQVNISAEREENKTETKTSVIKITPKQISQIPSIGGQSDLAQYLQVVPGIVFTGDQGGQLYIRGGSPIQNITLLDGMTIYNPFHSIGLFSVFDTDILRNIDVYTGGFGAEYGDRISSVIDISTRSGNKRRLTGKVEATTFGSKILLEGPMKPQTDSSESCSSFIISAKNSYLSQSSKVFYKYAEQDGIPFDFTDLYGKMSFENRNGSTFNIFGFNFADKVINYKDLADFHWNSSGGGLNFLVIPGKSPVVLEGIFTYSDYKIFLNESNNLPRSSEIGGFNIGLHFTYFLGKNSIKYGLDMQGFKTNFDFHNSVGQYIDQTDNTTELSGYLKYKFTKGKFIFEPGFRAQYYASLSEFSPEPRLAVKYNLSDKLRFKFAGGLYSQNLISASYDQDVVNLFYGFLSGPDNLPATFNEKNLTSKLQKAQHLIFGLEYDLLKNVSINIEPYFKNFSQLTDLNKNKIYDESDPASFDKPDNLKKDFIVESGDAEGVDFTLKYDYNQFYFWGVYSLGFVHRFDGYTTYYPHYDRRHNVNLIAVYKFGKNQLWEFSARWNFGSGFPFTKTQGYYENIDFSGGINTDYTNSNGKLAFIYDKYDGGRLPAYHRLDLSIKKKYYLGKNTVLETTFSVTNVYDRQNIFYADRITNQNIYQLPILPSFGVNFSF